MTQLLRGDCLALMKTLPDRSVDCFVCDLPYGQLASGFNIQPVPDLTREGKTITRGNCDWDIKLDINEFWVQVKRLCRNDHTPVLMFCNTKFGIELINSNPSWFRYDLVWNKCRGVSFLTANKMPLKAHEMVYVFSKRGAYYKRIDIDDPTKKAHSQFHKDISNTTRSANVYTTPNSTLTRAYGCEDGKRCPISVITMTKVGTFKDHHPTEKPIALYRWLLERYCPPNGTVLDPTAGSFNSIVAAHELGLTAVGIEMDEGFYNSAIDRLAPILATEESEEGV